MKTTLFIRSIYLRFLMTLGLRYILVRSNDVWKERYKMVIYVVIFICNQKMTTKYVIITYCLLAG